MRVQSQQVPDECRFQYNTTKRLIAPLEMPLHISFMLGSFAIDKLAHDYLPIVIKFYFKNKDIELNLDSLNLSKKYSTIFNEYLYQLYNGKILSHHLACKSITKVIIEKYTKELIVLNNQVAPDN